MPNLKSLADRQTDQAKARERLAERARKFAAKPVGGKTLPAKPKVATVPPTPPPVAERAQRARAGFKPTRAEANHSPPSRKWLPYLRPHRRSRNAHSGPGRRFAQEVPLCRINRERLIRSPHRSRGLRTL